MVKKEYTIYTGLWPGNNRLRSILIVDSQNIISYKITANNFTNFGPESLNTYNDIKKATDKEIEIIKERLFKENPERYKEFFEEQLIYELW